MSANDFFITGSRHFTNWLADANASIAFTTYQAGKLFVIGLDGQGRLSVFERTFDRAMGLHADARSIWLGSRSQIWRLENVFDAGTTQDGFDAVYLPQVAFTTGDVDLHDLHLDGDGRPLFASALFNCLAHTNEAYSFVPFWMPPFISKLCAEDRCHLNGFAMRDGRPHYASCVATTDVVDGWRDARAAGGVVLDLPSGEEIGGGFSMPHSPRWYRDMLWLLDSGNGNFGHVDLRSGAFEPVAFCPGYARGMDFHGDHAVLGLSLPRDSATFGGLAVARLLEERRAVPRCGIFVVNLASGDVVHWLRIEGMVTELFDIKVVKNVRRARLIGLVNDEIHHTYRIGAS